MENSDIPQKLKTFNIVISSYDKKLLDADFSFSTESQARNYALGVYKGLDIAEKNPTGIDIKPI